MLAVAHGVLQASILLQALTTPRLEEQAPIHFLDVAERNHWPFLGGAFTLAAVPLLESPVLAAQLERDLLDYLARVERRRYRPVLESNPRQIKPNLQRTRSNTAIDDLIPTPFDGPIA